MSASNPEIVSVTDAACAIWRDAPSWQGQRTAAVGRFTCTSAGAGRAMLDDVGERLRLEGFAAVMGPMDGDTWHAYRVITESDGSRPFPLEPVSGPHDHAAWTAAGFAPISAYVSARSLLADACNTTPAVMPGLSVVAWDGRDAEGLIGRVFDMSLAAFARNAFYKPITRDAFLDLYRPILPAVDPRFVLFAMRDDGSVAGFLFAYPNLAEGPMPQSIVIKTYASAERGAGRILIDAIHHRARDLGMTQAIHGLMHVDNASLDRSGRTGGVVFRRYALMGRRFDAVGGAS